MRPVCKCHGEEMICPSGWRCAVNNRAVTKAYRSTEKGSAVQLAYRRKYDRSPKGRARDVRWKRENWMRVQSYELERAREKGREKLARIHAEIAV